MPGRGCGGQGFHSGFDVDSAEFGSGSGSAGPVLRWGAWPFNCGGQEEAGRGGVQQLAGGSLCGRGGGGRGPRFRWVLGGVLLGVARTRMPGLGAVHRALPSSASVRCWHGMGRREEGRGACCAHQGRGPLSGDRAKRETGAWISCVALRVQVAKASAVDWGNADGRCLRRRLQRLRVRKRGARSSTTGARHGLGLGSVWLPSGWDEGQWGWEGGRRCLGSRECVGWN